MSDEQSMVDKEVEVGGASMTLAQLADLDTTEISEVRRFKFPKGIYLWRVEGAKLDIKLNSKVNEDQFVADVPLKCIAVISGGVDEKRGTSEGDCVEKIFPQSFWLKSDDPENALGQLKAFASDVGYSGGPKVGEIVAGIDTVMLVSPIRHAHNAQDPENPWSNLDRDNIRPATDEEKAAAAE